jgi:hypothetical protein
MMSDDFVLQVRQLIEGQTLKCDALIALVDDSWSDDERKLADILWRHTSSERTSQCLSLNPNVNDEWDYGCWRSDVLGVIDVFSRGSELLLEDLAKSSRQAEISIIQQIHETAVKARDVIYEIDLARRENPAS